MSTIRSKDTKPELVIRKKLFEKGFRYRLHLKEMPGCPDVVLPKYSVVIFINGCFWHQHACSRSRLPKTRTKWWQKKLEANKKRDLKNYRQLSDDGWRVIVLWECMIKDGKSEKKPEIREIISRMDSFIKRGRIKKMIIG